MNQQFVSVTDARAKLKDLMDIVMAGKSRVILVRDSKPQVALVRYDDLVAREEMSEKEWQELWDTAMREGRIVGKKWAKQQGIDLKKVTEEELYDLIDKVSDRP